MKALVYVSDGNKALQDRPKPEITVPTDAIIKMTKTTICGTDLHILKGDVPSCQPGRILGHEGVGIVDEVGTAVTSFKTGDRVSSHVLAPAVNVIIAKSVCIHTAPLAVGYLAIKLTGLKLSLCVFLMQILASIPFQKVQMRKLWSC
jgi:NADPH:quinone reductase-like Zn-dependent oxidoreductase